MTIRQKILRAIDMNGPMTMSSISRMIGVSKTSVSAVLVKMQQEGEIHISGKQIDDNAEKRYPRAVYAAGPGRAHQPARMAPAQRGNP